MAKARVRKPFYRAGASQDPASVHEGTGFVSSELTTESETIEHPDEKAWEKKTTRAKKAVVNKLPKKVTHPSNLVVRTATGAIYILLTVVCVLASEATTALYLALLSAICANEFYYMLRSDAKLPNELLGVVLRRCFLCLCGCLELAAYVRCSRYSYWCCWCGMYTGSQHVSATLR